MMLTSSASQRAASASTTVDLTHQP
jgi:hypothetical protein